MRYITALLFISLALPVSAQEVAETAEIAALQREVLLLNHLIQKAKAAHNFKALTLDSLLIAVGYSIRPDTIDAGYVVFVMPDSLARETRLVMREQGSRGLPFIKTDKPNEIRVGRMVLPQIDKALNP